MCFQTEACLKLRTRHDVFKFFSKQGSSHDCKIPKNIFSLVPCSRREKKRSLIKLLKHWSFRQLPRWLNLFWPSELFKVRVKNRFVIYPVGRQDCEGIKNKFIKFVSLLKLLNILLMIAHTWNQNQGTNSLLYISYAILVLTVEISDRTKGQNRKYSPLFCIYKDDIVNTTTTNVFECFDSKNPHSYTIKCVTACQYQKSSIALRTKIWHKKLLLIYRGWHGFDLNSNN